MSLIEVQFYELEGKVIERIEGLHKNSECITLYCTDGSVYYQKHSHDNVDECSVCVKIVNLIGEESILLGQEILNASENLDTSENCVTMVYYELETIKGKVVIRWCGNYEDFLIDDYCEEVFLVRK